MEWNILYGLDLLAIAVFAVSYYRNCYRLGYRIDFWHSQLFLLCVLPNFLLLPFARSELNSMVLKQEFPLVLAVLPHIFLITLVGYVSILVGGTFWRVRGGIGLRRTAYRVLDLVPRASRMLMSHKRLLILQSFLCVVLQIIVLAIYFQDSGFGFDLRAYTFSRPALRPVALLVSGYSVAIGSHCLARYVEKKERILLGCTLMLTFGLFFFGARSNILIIYMNVLICYLIQRRAGISLFKLASMLAAIVLAGLYLGSLRAGDYSIGNFMASLIILLFFGNNFSDLRDFAWVYADWDHVLWAGKTYLAAIGSFVPRFASEFRDTWGLGVATATTLGLDPQVHPGVRPGAFGEGYFNFGIIGVICVGCALGIVIRRVDTDVKRALAGPRPSMIEAKASTMLLEIAACCSISAGFSGLYVLALVYLFTWFCISVTRLQVVTFRPSTQ